MRFRFRFFVIIWTLSACATSQGTRPDSPASTTETPTVMKPSGRDPGLDPRWSRTLPPSDSIEPFRTNTIPGGLTCVIRLKELGIPHRPLPPLKGVQTPIRITGPIAGITYIPIAGIPLVCDCRLALALHRAGPFLMNLGITQMYFSSAYSYRLMPSGRLSQHAMGLAIDIHKVMANDELFDLRDDFALHKEDHCGPDNPLLNRLACLLKAWGLFDWVLTPDFDKAHANHFHLDIYDLHRRRFIPKGTPAEPWED